MCSEAVIARGKGLMKGSNLKGGYSYPARPFFYLLCFLSVFRLVIRMFLEVITSRTRGRV